MYESEFVYGIDGQSRFGDVELGAFLAKGVFFHEQRHHVTAGQELHYEVEVYWILQHTKVGFESFSFSTFIASESRLLHVQCVFNVSPRVPMAHTPL